VTLTTPTGIATLLIPTFSLRSLPRLLYCPRCGARAQAKEAEQEAAAEAMKMEVEGTTGGASEFAKQLQVGLAFAKPSAGKLGHTDILPRNDPSNIPRGTSHMMAGDLAA